MQTFQVEGMSCNHCAAAITSAIQTEDASARVHVDLAQHTVAVDSDLSQEHIRARIEAEGYTVVSVV